MGKYQTLNVLNNKPNADFMSEDSITAVANMINAKAVNRSQRKELTKTLGKIENIMAHVQKKVDRTAYDEYQKAVDQNYLNFFSCLGLTFLEKYHWKETEDNDHGQISSLLENVDKTIRKYAEMGYDTEDMVNLLEEKTGIRLVPDTH